MLNIVCLFVCLFVFLTAVSFAVKLKADVLREYVVKASLTC